MFPPPDLLAAKRYKTALQHSAFTNLHLLNRLFQCLHFSFLQADFITAPLRNAWLSASVDTFFFVINFRFQINVCAIKPALT
jgi:hypothetical protein